MAPTFKASSAQYPDSGTTSPTFFPDDFLMTWIPVFLIRHPALTFESWYKVESRVAPIDPLDKSWAFSISFHYTRDLYDWYMARYEAKKASGEPDSPCPMVIDADDVLEGESLARLCEACQMDPSLIEREWHSTDVSALNVRHQSYLGDFLRSTSVDRSKTSHGLTLESKRKQWEEQYGMEVTNALMSHVMNAMEDYDFLRSRAI